MQNIKPPDESLKLGRNRDRGICLLNSHHVYMTICDIANPMELLLDEILLFLSI